ncbi:unnamed protein product [Rotaria sp. Silwood2]|nr:unnamed protein product [Rotaria sp. Silwood2]
MQLSAFVLFILLLKTNFVQNSVIHTYDLASQMPSRFVCMFSVSWFGIGPSDPQGKGPDPYTNHWDIGKQGSCVSASQPDQCGTDGQRNISSYYRPLAGIYSSSGLDNESLARIDLMLTTL